MVDVLVLVSLGVFWARGILVAQAGTEPTPLAVEAQSPNHLIDRKFSWVVYIYHNKKEKKKRGH